MIRCIFFDTEIKERKCLDMQMTDKAICRTCEEGKAIKEMLKKIKDSGKSKKEEVMPEIEKKKYPKTKCEVEGCEKYVWRDRCCMIHYKEKHGIPRRVKKDKVSPPVIARSKATKQSKREIATPSARNDNKNKLGILAQMYAIRENKEKDLARIDSAIETIKEFAEIRA